MPRRFSRAGHDLVLVACMSGKVVTVPGRVNLMALRTPLTPHPWGGASLGADANCGVVNHRGEVFNNPGLFLADGSALPAAPGGPPALTIAAWAHHVADGIARPDSSSMLRPAG